MRTTMCAAATRRSRAALTTAVLLALSPALAACSGPDGAPETDDGGTTAVTLGVLPIVPSAALQLGIEEGIFADHGFDVTLETAQGGAALVPAVVSGEMQFALSNPLSTMLATEQGVDLRVVTGYSQARPEGDDVTSLWAAADSGIEEPADLAGKTVAVNTLKTMGEVSVRELVREAGGDPASVEFVELGFPDMPAALDAGHIDVAWVPEPFQTVLADEGATRVAYNYQETMPGVPTMTVITSGQLTQSDPELVEEFTAAVDEATAFAQANPDEVRGVLTSFLDMDAALADEVLIEDFDAEMNEDALQTLADLALQDGVLSKPVDLASFLP